MLIPDRVAYRRLVAVSLIVLSAMILIPNHYVSPVRASSSQPWSFRDDFNYTSISQLEAGGWSINPNPNVPTSYYGFRNSTLTLYTNGPDNAAFVTRSDVPANVSNWSVSMRGEATGGSYDSVQLIVPTSRLLYSWTANGVSNTFILSRNYTTVGSFPGYTSNFNVWHTLRLDMVSGTLFMYFDGSLIGNYTEPDKTVGDSNLKAIEVSASPFVSNAFDWVQATNSPQQQSPHFTLVASPSSMSLQLGQSTNSTIQLASYAGFTGTVTLKAVAPVPGPTAQLTLAVLVLSNGGTAVSTLTIIAQNVKISTMYQVNVTGTSGSLSASATIQVGINSARPPIIINSNAGFTADNGVSGGTGTSSNPYIISGWSINGWNYPISWNPPNATISITNTTAYFVIQNVVAAGAGAGPGIRLYNVQNGLIENSSMGAYLSSPVWAVSSKNILLRWNDMSGGGACTSPDNCSNADGVYLGSDSGLTLQGNSIRGALGNGASVNGCSNVTITGNSFSSEGPGLLLNGSTNISVSGNTFTKSGINVNGSPQQLSSYSISSSNLANGLPIYYYKDCVGLNIDGIPVGQLIIVNCSNVRVANLYLKDDYAPLQIRFDNSTVITHNTLAGTWFAYGAILYGSTSLTVSYNNFTSTGNTYQWPTGLSINQVTNSTVQGNNFVNNHIDLDISNSRVSVFHNNFLGCGICGTLASDSGTANTWDNGFPSGGNFWSDYGGSDPDKDGIGDTPYSVCCAGAADRYPLMKPYTGPDPTVSITKTINFGGFSVTTSGSLTISPGTITGTISSTAVNSTTNAILFSKAYTISNLKITGNSTRFLLNVEVSPDPLSADITLTQAGGIWSATVMVTRQLDIAARGTVDIVDIGIVMAAFDSYPGSPLYSSRTDVAARGSIDIVDVGIFCAFYGAPDYS